MNDGHSSTEQRIEACASNPDAAPRDHFDAPQTVADAADASYEARLSVLQRWRRHHPEDAVDVDAAISALEAGAALGVDQPEGTPPGWGYGARGRT